ncbi:MAG: hypothetical protein DLM59_05990 [Pseudonocardiales bacterium]|nr:MAG: hypothetical protein DLM59_05990 [Pseudonocardiales bacterium]
MSRYLSSNWLTVALVRGLRRSLISLSRRVRTTSARRNALGPAGTTSVRSWRRFVTGSIPP